MLQILLLVQILLALMGGADNNGANGVDLNPGDNLTINSNKNVTGGFGGAN